MTKFSIIIPVYNCEKYLKNCLSSILNQSFTDFEIICIDDGSTDNSLEILKEYPQIKLIKQSNLGSGIARNNGLEIAKGEYILFVDSDDRLVDDALLILNNNLTKQPEPLDLLIFGGLSCSKTHHRKGSYSTKRIPKKYFKKTFNKNDIKTDIFKFPTTAWTKAYRREFLTENNIKFQEIFVGQDQIFFVKSMLLADKIFVLKENLYCYLKNRKGSITTTKKKTNISPIPVFFEVEKFLNEIKLPDSLKLRILNHYFLKATFWLTKMEKSLKSNYYKEYMSLLSHIKATYPNHWWKRLKVKQNDSYLLLKFKWLILSSIKRWC